MSDDLTKLLELVEDLQTRLREETEKRVELERRCNVLEKLIYKNPETGLGTRDYLMERIREEIDRATRYPSSTTLLTLCSPSGNSEKLNKLGAHLIKELRESDHVFNLSTSGLAILLVETPQEGAKKVLDRIAGDLEHFIRGYGYSVTTFPLDTNVADEFFSITMERHREISNTINDTASDESLTKMN